MAMRVTRGGDQDMTFQATKRQSINPGATRAMYAALHFSQATRVGNAIWVSGQVGIDAAMKPAKGMEAQAHLALQGLRSVLEAAGASLADVVELMTFHTDLRGEMQAFALPRSLSVMDRGRRDATGPAA